MDATLLVYLLTGAVTGLVGSLLGLGGGVFLVPLLTLAFGLPIRSAVAASLVCVIATATASATTGLRRGLVNVRLGLFLELATSIGGVSGGLLAASLSTRTLYSLFAATLALMGVIVAIRSGRRNVLDSNEDPGRLGGRLLEGENAFVYRPNRLGLGLAASLVAGAVSGLLGLGGGIIKVPVLNAFCGVPIRVATATSTFMIGVTASASAFLYLARGDVLLPVTAAVALGALPGSLAGSHLSHKAEPRALKILMAVVLLGVAAQMALRMPRG